MNVIFVILLGLLGAVIVNYLSDVLPVQRKLGLPACANCQTPFTPVNYLSFTPCASCRAKRSIRVYLVLASGILVSLALWIWPPQAGIWISLLILTYFGVVAVIDIEHRLIMHIVSLAGAILFGVIGILLNGWMTTLIGGLAGGGVMFIFYLIGTAFAKYRAKKLGQDDDEEALGFGDVTISAVLGLLTGWPGIMMTLLIGVLIGGLFSLLTILILSALRRYDPMNVFTAYGPFLLLGAVAMVFFRDTVISIFFG